MFFSTWQPKHLQLQFGAVFNENYVDMGEATVRYTVHFFKHMTFPSIPPPLPLPTVTWPNQHYKGEVHVMKGNAKADGWSSHFVKNVLVYVFVLDLFWRENILVYLIKSLWGSNCLGWQVVCIQGKSLLHLW